MTGDFELPASEYTNDAKGRAEKALDRKLDKQFRSHRDVPNGRNFRFWEHSHSREADKNYRDNFDSIFPNAPGAGI